MKKEYVCGFAFFGPLVVLIKKNRPEWQAGQLNGLGGKIEPGETSFTAMAREFQEETGLLTMPRQWKPFCKYKTHRGIVYFLTMDLHQADVVLDEGLVLDRTDISRAGAWFRNMKTNCEEGTLHIFNVYKDDDPYFPRLDFDKCRPNLNWLIPMALNIGKEEAEYFYAEECYPISSEHWMPRLEPEEPRPTTAVDPPALLEKAGSTFRERQKQYGNNYKQFGLVMEQLFPGGVTIAGAEQWNRFGILVHIMTKMTRYSQRPHQGHQDSIHDIGVYSFILESLDLEGGK